MSTAINPLAAIPPWIMDHGAKSRWVTPSRCAELWNKTPNTIRKWCEIGFFSTLNIPTYRDPSGRWYIRLF